MSSAEYVYYIIKYDFFQQKTAQTDGKSDLAGPAVQLFYMSIIVVWEIR